MTRYLFIDGEALHTTCRRLAQRYFGTDEIDLEYRHVRGHHDKAFYYDAFPQQKPGESDVEYEKKAGPQRALMDKIANIDFYHVYEGDARYRRGRGLEQKKVDILIAVDMLRHSHARNMDEAMLMTNDSDFTPLLDALVQGGMFVTLWFDPIRAPLELKRSADARSPFTITELQRCSTDAYRRKHEFPSPSYEGHNARDYISVEAGKFDNGPEFHLWTDTANNNRAVLVIDDHPGQPNKLHIRHTDGAMCFLMADDIYGLKRP